MLEKTDIPLIPDGYPLVVAMNALMDAVKSVSQVINNKKKAVSVELKEVMLKSSWSGVMAALALLLDTWWVGNGGAFKIKVTIICGYIFFCNFGLHHAL